MGPVALVFLGYLAWSGRALLGDVLAQADRFYLFVGVLFWSAAHLVSPLFGVAVLGGDGPVYGKLLCVHALNLPARYIPGGIWHTVGRLVDLGRLGVAQRRLAAFVFLENSLAASVTLGVGGAIVWAVGEAPWSGVGAVCALGGSAGLALSWFIVNRWVLARADGLSPRRYAAGVAVTALFWLCASAAFIAYMHAFAAVAQSFTALEIGGAYLLSWGFGFAAVFAPQGIGVFEATLGALLSPALPLATMAVLAAGFRAVVMCADILIWLLPRALPVRWREAV